MHANHADLQWENKSELEASQSQKHAMLKVQT